MNRYLQQHVSKGLRLSSKGLRLRGSVSTGAILGCDTDEERWMQSCSIPLFPGKWNDWWLVRTLVDEPNQDQVIKGASNAMRFWFSKTAKVPGVTLGHADNLKVEIVGPDAFQPTDVASIPRITATIASCPEEWSIEPPFIGVKVRFVYRGVRNSMPWPVARSSIAFDTLTGQWCPLDATWLVTTALKPDPKETVPDESDEPDLGDLLGDAGKKAGDALFDATWPILLGLGLVTAVVVLK